MGIQISGQIYGISFFGHNFWQRASLGKFMAKIWSVIKLAQDHKWSIPLANLLPQALTPTYYTFSPVACDRSPGKTWEKSPKKVTSCTARFGSLGGLLICRFRLVIIWFPQNTFFISFFTGREFIMVYHISKLVLKFQFDLQNPLKQPKMRIFEKWKIIVLDQNYGIF